MLDFAPAFLGGIPGGLELLVILFVMVLLFGIPVALALVLGYRYVQGQQTDDRVAELEAELEDLKAQLDRANDEEERRE